VDKVYQVLPLINSVTTITSADICSFCIDAESIVDARLFGGGYTVPMVGVPLLSTLATDISIYRLLTRRVFTQEQINKSDWPDRYKEALDMLVEIQAGTLPLVTVAGTATDSRNAQSNTQNLVPTFSERRMERQYVDNEKLWDSFGTGEQWPT
jgi:phage gp36-like protein